MILPGKTEAGSAGMQPCRGTARWAHRDDAGERGKALFALFLKTHRIERPRYLENPRPKGGIYQLTENAPSPFQAEPGHPQNHRENGWGFCSGTRALLPFVATGWRLSQPLGTDLAHSHRCLLAQRSFRTLLGT
jgi:hypothetical protein